MNYYTHPETTCFKKHLHMHQRYSFRRHDKPKLKIDNYFQFQTNGDLNQFN